MAPLGRERANGRPIDPWFLKEEPLPGKPDPERLALYMSYLHYQKIRGPLSQNHGQNSKKGKPVLRQAGEGAITRAILVAYLGEHGDTRMSDLSRETGMDVDKARLALYRMERAGWVVEIEPWRRNVPGGALWGLTAAGRSELDWAIATLQSHTFAVGLFERLVRK